MESLAGFAAIGIAVASAIGMAAICLLTSRQGFAAATVEPVDAAIRRHLTARLTYAVVGVCLAANAVLAFAFVAESKGDGACAGVHAKRN